jgi:hypothetical protein
MLNGDALNGKREESGNECRRLFSQLRSQLSQLKQKDKSLVNPGFALIPR